MKARPERIRFTLFDDAHQGVPLDLPSQRHWFAGLVFGAFFLTFAVVAGGMIAKMGLHKADDVFGLMMLLFDVFWLLGWSVGVFILGALTALFLFYRESARLQGGRLVHVPRLGPLKVVCEYDLAKMSNLRLENAKDGLQARVRFDYGGRTAGIGDAMTHEDAEVVLKKLRSALPMRAREEIGWAERVEAARRIEPPLPLAAPRVSHASSLALIAAHFLLVYGFFIRDFGGGRVDFGAVEELSEIFAPLAPALVALAVSHGISFFLNFIRRREYVGETIASVMMAPYRRIVVMHLTIIFGGWLVMLLDTPAPALALLVALKTAVDLRAHRREHAPPPMPSP